MKVAILSSASGGGAGVAAYRIYEAIKNHQSHICDVDFIDMRVMGQVPDHVTLPGSATNGTISNTHYTADFASEVRQHVIDVLLQYDVVNIQWASFLLSTAEIYELAKTGKRIVFTLHDFYYLTGGCHYPSTCKQYLKSCRLCPQVDTRMMPQKDVESAQDLKRKIFSFSNVILTAPSEYIVNRALEANLVSRDRAIIIRNAYEPIESWEIVNDLSDRIHILLIADSFHEIRKQLQLAIDGFKELARVEPNKIDEFVIHLVGRLDKEVLIQLEPFGYEVKNHGHLSKHADIVDVYCQCEYLLTPSLDDNWPNILVEGSAYGVTPIVGPGHGCEEFVQVIGEGVIFSQYTAESVAISLSDLPSRRVFNGLLSDRIRALHDPLSVSQIYFSAFSH